MRRTNPVARGFTLIELMVVVTIIGILASVAVPAFQMMVIRSKAAERILIVQTIKRAIQDWVVQNGGLPAGVSTMTGPPTPPMPPGTAKRLPNWNQADWDQILGVSGQRQVDGAVYYSYSYLLAATGNTGLQMDIWAYGDLDGDGVIAVRHAAWVLTDGAWSTSPTVEDPPGWLSFDVDDGTF